MDAKLGQRPWGEYEIIFQGKGYQVKRIEVRPLLRFSLQKHLKRDEQWIFLSGNGLVMIGDKEFKAEAGSYFNVPKQVLHRVKNLGNDPLVFVETQFGSYLGEDDIVRIADDFGRS